MSQTANASIPDSGPFVPTAPGDLITADLLNDIQVKTREEIARKVAAGVAGVKKVESADNAAKLEGKTADELEQDIIRRALERVSLQSGYKRIYKRLPLGDPAFVRHDMHAAPLVDVYELRDFEVVASADGVETVERVLWYLYHRTEMRIRRPRDADRIPGQGELVTIEESRGPVFKYRFEDMLKLHGAKYGPQSTLGDVVNEFWKALFSDPNDSFDETSFANSPWFDRCCGDRRTVESLVRGGEWNDLYLKMVPLKGVNPPALLAPPGVLVEHYDMDSLGLWWLPAKSQATREDIRDPLFSVDPAVAEKIRDRFGGVVSPEGMPVSRPNEIFVMVLLKV
ncbi:MAG TPA: hypothetical protein VM890_12325 [Longimicrobium sp.]|jgi:hypothetical protein|nr:hypothetical protein [Longimicrobium sp.]